MEKHLRFAILLILICSLAGVSGFAQECVVTKRVYANRQEVRISGLLASVSSRTSAIDQSLLTYSTLSVPIGALNLIQARQYLKFPNDVPANTPVTVKLKLNASVLGVLENVTIQPFKNLQETLGVWNATTVGSSVSLTSLINAANADGEVEIRLQPNASYQGVWINIGSALSVGSSLGVYEAYILEAETSPVINCNAPIDVLSGVKSNTLGLGIVSSLNGVADPRNAIDGDPNTATTLNVNVAIASDVYETVIFNQLSQPGDSTEIVLQNPNSNDLLSLSLLTGFSIQAYNGTTAVGSPITNSSTALSLSLLSGMGSSAKYSLKVGINEPYDRIEIKMSGVAGVFSQTKIYEVSRSMAKPKASVNGSTSQVSICQGNAVTLAVENQQSCTNYNWYANPSGGTILATATSYTTPNLNSTTTYYVEAVRSNACSETSGRIPVTVTVNPLPSVNIDSPSACIEHGDVVFTLSNKQHAPISYQIQWTQAALDAGFPNISTDTTIPANNHISFAIPANIEAADYSGSIIVKNGNGCVSTAKNIQLTISPAPEAPHIDINSTASY